MSDVGTIVAGKSLQKRYDSVSALDGVDFTVRAGEICGFLGPNGAGKTTLIKLITCTSFFDGGTLSVFGMTPAADGPQIKAQIGVAPQDNNLDPDFTVRENLLVYARYFSIPRAEAVRRTDELLGFVSLGERAGTKVNDLSGGMKRRLIIARSLINDPRLIILDEPTTGLDPQARRHIWDLVLNLRQQGRTVILTTHYMEEAEKLCDRIHIIDKGRLLVEGTPHELIHRHIGRETIELSNCNGLDLSSIPGKKMAFSDRVFIHGDDTKTILAKVADLCADVRFVARPSNLEDLFIYLTGRDLRE